MKKHIYTWSYWLGLVSAVIALTMRAFNALGVFLPGTVIQGTTIWYMSFYKAALLFFLINIATAIHIYSRVPVNRDSDAATDKRVVEGRPPAKNFRTAAAGS